VDAHRGAGVTAVALSPVSLAATLERDRLAHRVRRLEAVLDALTDRALHRGEAGDRVPPALERAIADFRIELRAVRWRLAELER
jgi:hypothetical protein